MELTSALLYLIIALASTVVLYLRRNFSYWKKLGIPHEEPHYYWGNTKGFRNKYIFGEIMAKYYRKFKGTGPFAGMYFNQVPVALLLDTDFIKRVLIKDFTNFIDRGMYSNPDEDPLSAHLFFMNGDKWRNLRNKLSPTFTSGKMKNMFPTMQKISHEFMEVLADRVKQGPVVEMRDILGRFTVDIFTNVAFGIDSNSLKNTNDPFLKLGRKSIEGQRHNYFVMSLIESFPNVARKLGMRVVAEDVHQFFTKTFKETVEYREKNGIKRNDFLNILIGLKKNEGDSDGLTIEEIAAQAFVFYVAGFETTASTIGFALYELALHPELQDRLREEINEVYETEGFSYESIMGMPYLEQVLLETLRKYPVLPVLNRQALTDYVVPGHPKYILKKGLPLIIPVLGIHYDPELYPNPEQFDPERFSPEKVQQRDAMEWLSFGDGPRSCIGMRYGKLQARLGLVHALRSYRFSVSPKTQIPLTFVPTSTGLTPTQNMYLTVEAV